MDRVYPRACGGTSPARPTPPAAAGLSPRVRGNRGDGHQHETDWGSIPARAGEPSFLDFVPHVGVVYPRACGGTGPRCDMEDIAEGLSPRVRGNPEMIASVSLGMRSIPARAGEPEPSPTKDRRNEVYPRACGGTHSRQKSWQYSRGLSPRVRGNQVDGRDIHAPFGSIPARAGEPVSPLPASRSRQVYPRACGGTSWTFDNAMKYLGLSPRVRGNPSPAGSGTTRIRSIPARAGEPTSGWDGAVRLRVYPRACGGTWEDAHFIFVEEGLSPRVRGNPHPTWPTRWRTGSIPARAGEPDGLCSLVFMHPVYPRACGGTRLVGSLGRIRRGLSPRVRGNQLVGLLPLISRGSIPARAGEPWARSAGSRTSPVYPRACGGTNKTVDLRSDGIGLSPRVRGNLSQDPEVRRPLGSIPARAGEPASHVADAVADRVYPRACGGTGWTL